MAKAVDLIFKAEEKSRKMAAKAAKKLAKAEVVAAKKASKALKQATPKRTKLTDEQKEANKAKRAYETEMRRREKWEREFQAKFEGVYSPPKAKAVTPEPEVEDGFVC